MKTKPSIGPASVTWLILLGLTIFGAFLSRSQIGNTEGSVSFLRYAIIILSLYFLPALIAENRRHRQRLPIYLLNLLLGATVIGWIAALVWSTTTDVETAPAAPAEPAPAEPAPAPPAPWAQRPVVSVPRREPSSAYEPSAFAENRTFQRGVIIFSILFIICAGVLVFLVKTDPALR